MYEAANDTIAGVSTPPGNGGIAVVRLSGGDAFCIIRKIFRPGGKARLLKNIKSHTIRYGTIVDGGDSDGGSGGLSGGVIDEVLVSFMCAPKTYTREDVVEISCHGGVKATQQILSLVLRSGARLAEPGEFTKRAFLNGRIDLSQAEAVMDVINAKTDAALKAAVKGLSGGLKNEITDMRNELLRLIAHIEASIDYPEHDMETINLNEVAAAAASLTARLDALIKTFGRGKIIREGIETVILGKPNVGKSSVLNVLLDEERAIVTDVPGTTRDVLTEFISIGDIPLKIADTAGIRETADAVEAIGVSRAVAAAEGAELILFVLDGGSAPGDEDFELLGRFSEKKVVVLVNKSDLMDEADGGARNFTEHHLTSIPPENIIFVSAKNHTGFENLYTRLRDMFLTGEITTGEAITVTNVRHKNLLERAQKSLTCATDAIIAGFTEDCVAIDLTECYKFLGDITGETLDEDIIDKIFSTFCLGK